MAIKHVVLDLHTVVTQKNPEFVPASIMMLSQLTLHPWDACAYALAESVEYFRSINLDGAFVANPRDFASEFLTRIGCTHIDSLAVNDALDSLYHDYPPMVNYQVCNIEADLRRVNVATHVVGNTNMVSFLAISEHLMLAFGDSNTVVLTSDIAGANMPHDAFWLALGDSIKAIDETATFADILFVTTTARYGYAAHKAGLAVSVVSDVIEAHKAINSRLAS